MRRTVLLVILAAFLIMSIAAIAAERKQARGSVIFACPKGNAVKLKVGDAQVIFWVYPHCPRRHHLSAQIKALKAGDIITVKYFTQQGKHYLTEIKKKT